MAVGWRVSRARPVQMTLITCNVFLPLAYLVGRSQSQSHKFLFWLLCFGFAGVRTTHFLCVRWQFAIRSTLVMLSEPNRPFCYFSSVIFFFFLRSVFAIEFVSVHVRNIKFIFFHFFLSFFLLPFIHFPHYFLFLCANVCMCVCATRVKFPVYPFRKNNIRRNNIRCAHRSHIETERENCFQFAL